ncbi:MAG: transferase [Cytophagales bacterium CG12_big_fil_rev_8_21_14_0_65_40_12]|nr:MAG: transferase [Cytophagales bacterium CG12_big_fil_rev_8_21_14_0_65_40_12]PIW06198.1 MAG: transferase [Cytophagales bacterium CG17_big_fil_post_rev_8_21_14_2_50_40_13]
MEKDIYVLGTGLSHNGSCVILKNGKVAAGIEKERISRIKHDGGNDNLAIQYCLEMLNITLDDIALAVQCENFVVPQRDRFQGERIFKAYPNIELHSISHHLAHAYSTIGTCPYERFNILIIDGCGSPYQLCSESLNPKLSELGLENIPNLICEKDSFYHYDKGILTPLFKDFSEVILTEKGPSKSLPTTAHSIGGFYAYMSNYCFGNMSDAGKLMGLAPYGKPTFTDLDAFLFYNNRVFVKEDWKSLFDSPASDYAMFKSNFQHYANAAFWAQQQVEKAILYVVAKRAELSPALPLCYSGGVALNAVANAKILKNKLVENLYIEPAAGDNGLALGCAYYGWLKLLKGQKVDHDGNTCFGKNYDETSIENLIDQLGPEFEVIRHRDKSAMVNSTALLIQQGNTIGWFQGGAEFGPRALGKRSILASPFIAEMQREINANIKLREDFRPFAPSVLKSDVLTYFDYGFESPYMLLVDQVRPEWRKKLKAISHVDYSARVQTVAEDWNPLFHQLLKAIKQATGHGIVLNTSFNIKGQPIVETPNDAMQVFRATALDVLVIGHFIIRKKATIKAP